MATRASHAVPTENYLRPIAFFRYFTDGQLTELTQAGTLRQFDADFTIFKEGAKVDYLYVILSGEVKVLKQKDDGAELELARLHSGDLLGEMALFDDAPRSASAVTVLASEFLAIGAEDIIRLLTKNPSLIRGMLAELSRKVRKTNDKYLQDVMEKQELRLEVEREKLRSLVQFASAENEETSVKAAFQAAVDRICNYANWAVGHVWEVDENAHDSLYSSAIWHLQDPHAQEAIRSISETCQLLPGMELPGKVLSTRKPAWFQNSSEFPNSARMKAAKAAGMQASLAFPVVVGSQVVSVLEFFSEKPMELGGLQMDAISALSTRLSRTVERKQWEDKMVHNAFHDALTDLPNRALFQDRLSQAVSRTRRNSEHRFAVIFLDLDRFKVVNDSKGHRVGDQLLVQVGARLKACLRTTDTVARLGGDEFAILLDDIKKMSDVPRTVERIRRQLQLPISLEECELSVLGSMGIALSSTGYERAEDMLRDADTAMYRAKSKGKGRHEIFDRTMHQMAVDQIELESGLRRAIEQDELRLHFQPVVNLQTGQITSMEALVRWQHPERGLLNPIQFLPSAEEAQLMLPLTKWVVRKACSQAQDWKDWFSKLGPFSISVNITAPYLTRPELREELLELLREKELTPEHLRLEITEGEILGDIEVVSRALSELGNSGIKVCIDDFGTGYSSLSHLANFDIHVLKIDQSFIRNLDGEDRSSAIVHSIITMANNLGLEVIAEGVETQAQLDYLRSIHCEFGQGYLYSPPVDARSMRMLLQNGLQNCQQAPQKISRANS